MFDPSKLQEAVKKIKKHTLELDKLNTEFKSKCKKKKCNLFPQEIETEKPNKI